MSEGFARNPGHQALDVGVLQLAEGRMGPTDDSKHVPCLQFLQFVIRDNVVVSNLVGRPLRAAGDDRQRSPIEIQGTVAMMTRPTSSATRYGQIAPMASSGGTLPILQAR